MLLYLLLPCLTFLLFLNSLPLKSLPSWTSDARLLSFWFWKDFSSCVVSVLINNASPFRSSIRRLSSKMSLKKSNLSSRVPKNGKDSGDGGMSLLDLPEFVLEAILEKLPPSELCKMAQVCSSLRNTCRGDYLWERHLQNKWGKFLPPADYQRCEWYVPVKRDYSYYTGDDQKGLMSRISDSKLVTWIASKLNERKKITSSPAESMLSLYVGLETGRICFPAQVYNRENGHAGFVMSCYDAYVRYDPITRAFEARYPPHGKRPISIEDYVRIDRLRTPPLINPPHDLHISDCLNELRPGDHIEIQWRRNRDYPYGWWYGVVGHLDLCNGYEGLCHCHASDTVVLEFNQYAPGSRWRRTLISRKDHREEGSDEDGFYGGIRKIRRDDEIAAWQRLWPKHIME